jgi:uncharacterized membrane protein
MGEDEGLKPVVAAGVVLGIGLGGFVDGILLHQVFQLHSMLSGRVPLDSMANMRTNMTADGLFHAAMLLVTVAGIFMLFNAARRADVAHPTRALIGAMIMGWGLFNVVEGTIDHQLLGLHHVVERLGLSIWDWLFLVVSLGFVALGRRMTKGRPA